MNTVNAGDAIATGQAYGSAGLRACLAVGILAMLGVAAIAAIASTKAEIDLLQRALAGDSISVAEALANGARQQLVNWIFMGLYAASAVAFIAWMYRTSQNLGVLNGYDRRCRKSQPRFRLLRQAREFCDKRDFCDNAGKGNGLGMFKKWNKKERSR